MGELIERQATIDAVNNAFDRETLLAVFVRSIALRAIRDMPSVQPEPQWIPVSERMPEEHESMFAKYYNTPKWNNSMWLKESDKMLVSVEVPGNEIIVDTAKMLDGKWFFGLSFVDKKVIAWMPLPEVYKPNK